METANAKPTEDQRGLTAGGSFSTGGTKPYDSVGRRFWVGDSWLEAVLSVVSLCQNLTLENASSCNLFQASSANSKINLINIDRYPKGKSIL